MKSAERHDFSKIGHSKVGESVIEQDPRYLSGLVRVDVSHLRKKSLVSEP